MKIKGQHYRSISVLEDGWGVSIFDQRALPWQLVPVELRDLNQAVIAIKDMWVRGSTAFGDGGGLWFMSCLAGRCF